MHSNGKSRHNEEKSVLRKMLSKTSTTLQIQDSHHNHRADNVTLRLGDLEHVIELVNWIPKSARLTELRLEHPLTDKGLAAAIENQLPEPLRSRMMEILHTPIAQGRIENPYLYRRSGTARFDEPEKEATMRLLLVLAVYDDILRFRESLDLILPLVRNEKIKYLRECPTCGKVFFAVRENQWYWPTACAKERRQKKWARDYEKKHGHPYRPRRKPPHLEKVRKVIGRLWPNGSFERDYENEKEIAAQADITVKQCQTALDYLAQIQKRAKDSA